MKRVLISVAVSIFIMLIIPFIIVQIARPAENAVSTEPVAPTQTATQ